MSNLDNFFDALKEITVRCYELEDIAKGCYACYNAELGRNLMEIASEIERLSGAMKTAYAQEIRDEFDENMASIGKVVDSVSAGQADG